MIYLSIYIYPYFLLKASKLRLRRCNEGADPKASQLQFNVVLIRKAGHGERNTLQAKKFFGKKVMFQWSFLGMVSLYWRSFECCIPLLSTTFPSTIVITLE